MTFPYQDLSLEDRLKMSKSLVDKCPGYIPILVNFSRQNSFRSKYLAPKEITVGQFISTLRKELRIKAEESVYLFVGETFVPIYEYIFVIYDKYKDIDGFLYLTIAFENVFG